MLVLFFAKKHHKETPGHGIGKLTQTLDKPNVYKGALN